MDASHSSLVTIGLDGEDLICADPELGQRLLRCTINRMPDGTVILVAHQRGINVDADAMIVRDRLQRYHMRRQFGPEAAPWNPERDELRVSSHESTRNSSMAENNATIGPGAQGIHFPLPTGQSMGRFRDRMSMEEPSRNYISQIRFDIEALGEHSGVNSVGGLAEAERLHVPTDRRVSIVVAEDLSADSRGGNLPTAQSTRFPLSLQRSFNNSELRDHSMDLTGATHILDSYVPNSRAAPAPASGPGSAAPDQTTSPHGLNVQECNMGSRELHLAACSPLPLLACLPCLLPAPASTANNW